MPDPPEHAFSHDFQVPERAIDALGHANNVEYVRWVQDVAGAHWLSISPAEAQDRYIWVVREHRIRYLQSAFAGETLRATTWVLLDPKSGRPVRVTAEMVEWLHKLSS